MDALDILRYTKNYVGELQRADGKRVPGYYFADEREWRYALETKFFHEFLYMEKAAGQAGMMDTIRGLIEDKRLSFKPRGVRYILIVEEDERPDIKDHIRNLKEQFTEEEIEDLVSKICTLEEIKKSSTDECGPEAKS